MTEYNYTIQVDFNDPYSVSNSGKFPDKLAININPDTEHFWSDKT